MGDIGAGGEFVKKPENCWHLILIIILIGNTFTNMTLSSLTAVLALREFSAYLPKEAVEFFTWLVTTFLLLVLGEITPKIYARRNSEMISVVVLPAYEIMLKIFSPVFTAVEFIVKKFSSGKQIVPFGRLAQFSVSEIRQLFSESNLDGMLGAESSVMVDKVLQRKARQG